jgi:hypothetical protein
MKYSSELIYAAVGFMQAANKELGDIADEKIEAIFDAFDPSLRRQILMLMIKGELYGPVRIRLEPGHKQNYKINAIKEIRAFSGFGLKEAKDLVDLADSGKIATIEGTFSMDQRSKLKTALAGTGYEVV